MAAWQETLRVRSEGSATVVAAALAAGVRIVVQARARPPRRLPLLDPRRRRRRSRGRDPDGALGHLQRRGRRTPHQAGLRRCPGDSGWTTTMASSSRPRGNRPRPPNHVADEIDQGEQPEAARQRRLDPRVPQRPRRLAIGSSSPVALTLASPAGRGSAATPRVRGRPGRWRGRGPGRARTSAS
jgi:hypothetical protein